ncbi:hypothetical protein SD77_3620 [Bacillus badius]|uniref:Uncharacterized protein n=1 Tax=Bacillus badius TaxID=1455 RepID=A0ABR5AVX5_BACBA|nr:hypothetical protein SD78_1367 [Bacillus badius]KIL78819.1 hypothetical protein SD77_3620 [Bacillus badius]
MEESMPMHAFLFTIIVKIFFCENNHAKREIKKEGHYDGH